MKKQASDAVPAEVRMHPESESIDLTEVEASLEEFSEVDVFAFLGVPYESQEKYLDRSLELLLEHDRVGKVFAPEAYEEFLDGELRGLKVNYHSPESRSEELSNIAEAVDEIDSLVAPTMDYTVPRNYIEASNAFPSLETPESNQLLSFPEFRVSDGTLHRYIFSDLSSRFQGLRPGDPNFEYTVNDSDVFFPGVQYSDNPCDYFGKFFFSPRSEAVRKAVPQEVKDVPKKFLEFDY